MIGLWQNTYNRVRPHSSLGYRPPAPGRPTTRAWATDHPRLGDRPPAPGRPTTRAGRLRPPAPGRPTTRAWATDHPRP